MPKYKKYFPWFKNNKKWVYADSSATSLKPYCVIEAINEYYEKYSTNPHNNDSSLSSYVNLKIKETRKEVASFIGVSDEKQIIFTANATESLNIIADNVCSWLKKDDEVILSFAEHSSNLLPWIEKAKTKKFKIKYAAEKETNELTEDAIIASITKKTKVISVSNASNLFGYTISISNIVKQARSINPDIIIIVDSTQFFPHHQSQLDKWDVDFFACSMHKMCGPSGVGILFGKMKYLEKMNPLKLGGGTVSSIDSDYCVNLAPIPERFEAGTPNTEGIIGSLAAIKFIKKIGIKNIEQHELELKRYFDKKIKSIPNIIYMNEKAHFPIIALNYTNINPQDLANYFGKNKIVVRGGMSCAKLSYKITDNNVGYVRISLYFYNDFSDIDRIISVLKKFKPKDIVKNII